jgi:hypothetical protein
MGLARYALVFGLGFAAGHPAGREKLKALPAQVSALARRPEAQQLRDKGKAAADQAVQTAKDRLGSRSTPDAPSSTTVTAPVPGPRSSIDPEAATHGTLPPSAPRSTPR